jgi:hypothetical protein
MGLFDGYFDPERFHDSGGLLGRLLSLQQLQGLFHSGEAFDPQASADGQAPSMPQLLTVSPQSTAPALGATPTLTTQALASQTKSGDTADGNTSGSGQAGPGAEEGGQLPGSSRVGYFEFPTNANQAFGELSEIRERELRDTVSGDDHLSGVREGNVRRNQDGSLDVTNGTVVTLSLRDGHAKTVTVTNADVAHIDGKTGEVVIQKSPLRSGI